ncbi:MAG: hypothetical protein RXR51_05480, partial [Nitrososphaeria archaeon]
MGEGAGADFSRNAGKRIREASNRVAPLKGRNPQDLGEPSPHKAGRRSVRAPYRCKIHNSMKILEGTFTIYFNYHIVAALIIFDIV